MNKVILSVVATLLLAAPALAQETPEEAFQGAYRNLLAVVAGEIENLDGADLDKTEKKALKAFYKVEKTAEKLGEIGTDKKSLKKIGKIVKTLEKVTDTSGGDEAKAVGLLLPAVQKAVEDLVGALQYVVSAAADDAEGEQDGLHDSKNVAKVEKKIAKALSKAEAGDMFWASYARWSKAWVNYVNAVVKYVKAESFAVKLQAKEAKQSGLPAGVYFDSEGKLVNESGEDIIVNDIVIKYTVKIPGAPQQSDSIRLSESDDGGQFPFTIGTLPYDPFVWSSLWTAFLQIPNVVFNGTITFETNVGNIVYKL